MSSIEQRNRFKVVLIGDAGVGKSVFVNRHKTGEFEKRYIETTGAVVTTLKFQTTSGIITFDIWDCAGQEKFNGRDSEYYRNADAAIVMFDVMSKCTYNSVPEHYRKFKVANPSAPVVLCGNKVDANDRRVLPSDIDFHCKEGICYFDISSKSKYNTEIPFLTLAGKLLTTGK